MTHVTPVSPTYMTRCSVQSVVGNGPPKELTVCLGLTRFSATPKTFRASRTDGETRWGSGSPYSLKALACERKEFMVLAGQLVLCPAR